MESLEFSHIYANRLQTDQNKCIKTNDIMKKYIAMMMLAGGIFLLSQSFAPNRVSIAAFPDEVNKVLVASCYNCHSTDAKNKDAREALNFEKWDDYRVTKKIGLLGKICELVEEGKMPLAKYLDNNPDRKLSDTQKQLICEWSKKETSSLMGVD